MFAIIAALLVVCWLLGLFAFHVTSVLIHLVLVLALVLLILHFIRRRPAS